MISHTKSHLAFWKIMIVSIIITRCAISPGEIITPTPDLQEQDIGLEPTTPTTLPELIEALSSDNAIARMGAAQRLGTMGLAARDAVPALTRNLYYDGPDEVRKLAAWALGEIGPDAKAAVPLLTVTLLMDFVSVKREAAEALGKIGDPSAIPALVQSLDDEDAFVRIEAAKTIAILTNQHFNEVDQPGKYLDENGIPIIVKAAKRWWDMEGQYQDWVTP